MATLGNQSHVPTTTHGSEAAVLTRTALHQQALVTTEGVLTGKAGHGARLAVLKNRPKIAYFRHVSGDILKTTWNLKTIEFSMKFSTK